MKKLLWLGIVIIFSISDKANAVQRVVLAEEFTGTWCIYCPGAALGLQELKAEAGDTLAIIAYHLSDPFTVPEANARKNYYSVSGVPDVYFDGVEEVLGGYQYQSMYPYYKPIYDQRKVIDSPTLYTLSGIYYPSTRTGEINVTLQNTGPSSISGYLRTAVVLIDTPYPFDYNPNVYCEWVLTDMIPNANGISYAINPSQTIDTTLNFTIGSNYAENKMQFVAFFQTNSTKEVYGAAMIDLTEFTWVGIAEQTERQETFSIDILRENSGIRFYINNPDGKPMSVFIYNSAGRQVFMKNLNGTKEKQSFIFKSNPGVYFYKIKQDKGVIKTGKVLSL